MELIFLGTSCMVPTKERNVSGIYLDYEGEGILVDCGEGTQRQLNILGIPRNKIKKILISHFHGDHMSGVVGLLQTIGNETDDAKLEIYGPKGTKKFMKNILNSCYFDLNVDLKVEEVDAKKMQVFVDNSKYKIAAAELDHGVPCIGFRFIEKDKRKIIMNKAKKLGLSSGPLIGKLQRGQDIEYKGKTIKVDEVSRIQEGKIIGFIADTVFTENCVELAHNCDVLVSEASYTSKLEEKAEKYKHMTAKQAAYIANTAGVKRLILTHISQRYKTDEEILEEAKTAFEDVEVAFDFKRVKI